MAHYYEKLDDGAVIPRHFVPLVSRPDDIRPTRITDVKKMWKEERLVVPSVTTVLNVLDKAALNNWKINQYVDTAYTLSPADYQSVELWNDAVRYKTDMQMELAPKAGTDFHGLMEKYVLGVLADPDEKELCRSVFDVILEKVNLIEIGLNKTYPQYGFNPEVNFVDSGYGGQVDLVISDKWLIDYKTKATADKFKPGKMAYNDHRMQLAAYRKAIAPDARCANVFICLEDGQVDFHEHTEDELEKGWQLFEHALAIWNLQNR